MNLYHFLTNFIMLIYFLYFSIFLFILRSFFTGFKKIIFTPFCFYIFYFHKNFLFIDILFLFSQFYIFTNFFIFTKNFISFRIFKIINYSKKYFFWISWMVESFPPKYILKEFKFYFVNISDLFLWKYKICDFF